MTGSHNLDASSLFSISLHFNGMTFMNRDTVPRCKTCQQPVNKWTCSLYSRKSAPSGLSLSADGFVTASKTFIDEYERQGWHGFTIRELNENCFVLIPQKVIHFDEATFHLETYDQCDECGMFDELRMAHLGNTRVLDSSERISSREFARDNFEAPLPLAKSGGFFSLIAGQVAAESMKRNKHFKISVDRIASA